MTDKDEWLRCNALELAGNVGIIWRREQRLEEIKGRFVPIIKQILESAEALGQDYVWELAQLKLALLTGEDEPVEKLVAKVKSTGKSVYELGLFETPLITLHTIIRDKRYDPTRAYAASLLPLLIKDREVLNLEVETALTVENWREKPDTRLIAVLENIRAEKTV